MMVWWNWMNLIEMLNKPTIGDILTELLWFLVPLWIAALIGLFIGWSWKPKWASSGKGRFLGEIMPKATSLSELESVLDSSKLKPNRVNCIEFEDDKLNCSSSKIEKKEHYVTSEDFDNLRRLVEVKDGGPSWIPMMSRSLMNMSYEAWRRDPKTGPPQYRSRTVFENATPEMVRDFFWDDEFRPKWDHMLSHSTILEECLDTGEMVVQWIRKFPFFCSDREYIIGRRIWASGGTYYCVTKGIPCSHVPRRDKPRRVDLYYSSWCIRPVESKEGNGQVTACEVLLFHYEDMGIPWEIAKMGVRQGMWGAVKKIEPGLRAYEIARKSGAQLSQCARLAQINTKTDDNNLRSLETNSDSSEVETLMKPLEKPSGINIPKFFIIGGALVLACTLDRGLLTKTVIFGVARRFPKFGRQ